MNIGPLEIMMILLIALVVVGPSRLPEVGRSIGKGLREFRKVQDEVRDSINFNLDEPIRPKPVANPSTPRTPQRPPPAPADDEPDPAPAASEDPIAHAVPAIEDAPHRVRTPRGDHDASDGSVDPPTPAAGSAQGSSNGSTPGPAAPQE